MKGISAVKRRKIYDKFHGACMYCGKKLEYNDFEVEHIIPKSKGGGSRISNLGVACKQCNSKKKDKTVEEFKDYISNKIITSFLIELTDKLIYILPYVKNTQSLRQINDKIMEIYELAKSIEVEFHYERH